MCMCTKCCTIFAWNIIGLDIRYKVYSRLVSGGSNHCYFRWKMLFHGISIKNRLEQQHQLNSTLIFVSKQYRLCIYICIYKTVLRKVPLPCFPHFQEIIKRDAANNWLGFITKAADILA